MKTLYVLGNGFDLQHRLPTKPDDMRLIAEATERFPGEWALFESGEELWSNLEAGLAAPLVDEFVEHLEWNFPLDYSSDRESDRDSVVTEATELLGLPLRDFARNAEDALAGGSALWPFADLFGPSDYFVTFNYTNTLERLYAVPPDHVLHLHGSVYGGDLTFGYAPETLVDVGRLASWTEDDDPYVVAAYDCLRQRILRLEKRHQLPRLRRFLESLLERMERVVVYGFSFGMVDKPYFLELAQTLGDAEWVIANWCEEDLAECCSNFARYECGLAYRKCVVDASQG